MFFVYLYATGVFWITFLSDAKFWVPTKIHWTMLNSVKYHFPRKTNSLLNYSNSYYFIILYFVLFSDSLISLFLCLPFFSKILVILAFAMSCLTHIACHCSCHKVLAILSLLLVLSSVLLFLPISHQLVYLQGHVSLL